MVMDVTVVAVVIRYLCCVGDVTVVLVQVKLEL